MNILCPVLPQSQLSHFKAAGQANARVCVLPRRMRRRSARAFSSSSIRTCVRTRPQLYRNNASTFRELAGCQRRFLDGSAGPGLFRHPSRQRELGVGVRVGVPTQQQLQLLKLLLILTSLSVGPPCFRGESDTEVQQELLSWQPWS